MEDDRQLIELHLIQASSCDVDKKCYDELVCEPVDYAEFNTGFIGSQVLMSMVAPNIVRLELTRNSGQQFKVGRDDHGWFIAVVRKA